ncbi:putative SGNH hydrolase superfamily [Helianthus anomalus]
MVGPRRPQFVLFGSSIVQLSFAEQGWGAILADIYARKLVVSLLSWLLTVVIVTCSASLIVYIEGIMHCNKKCDMKDLSL